MTQKLTERQRRFVQEYLRDLNGTQAAIRAGYSPRGASVRGSKLSRHPLIAAEVEKGEGERSARARIAAETVLRELAKSAFSDIRDVVSWGRLAPHGEALRQGKTRLRRAGGRGGPADECGLDQGAVEAMIRAAYRASAAGRPLRPSPQGGRGVGRRMKLSARQRRFVEEYLIDGNARRAALRVGYKPKRPRGGYEVLHHPAVAAAIAEARASLSAIAGITPERVLAELGRLAFSDVRKLVAWSGRNADAQAGEAHGEGTSTPAGARVTLCASSELDADTAAAIREISEPGGRKVKLHDKTRPLELIARLLGMFKDPTELGPDGEPIPDCITVEFVEAKPPCEILPREGENESAKPTG
jgi:phage terminase small subunit